jgi:hypothetical protein
MDFYGFGNKKENKDKKNEEEKEKEGEENDDKRKENKQFIELGAKKVDPAEKFENDVNANNAENFINNIQNKLEYDMSESKKMRKMKVEDKVQMELMRRFRVKIFDIYINSLKERSDPFLQFTIGGNFSLKVVQDKKGRIFKKPMGKRGFSSKTEVLDNVEPNDKRPFETQIETEMRMSFSMLNSQKLMVELWDHEMFFTNKIIGYSTVNLIEIANGNVNLSVKIYQTNSKGKRTSKLT